MVQPRLFCQHYFIYGSPNGESSKGKCKYCGAEKEEPNSDRFMPGGFTRNFNFQSNVKRVSFDNPIDLILEKARPCHIRDRSDYLNIYKEV